jgi:hypothetical protein
MQTLRVMLQIPAFVALLVAGQAAISAQDTTFASAADAAQALFDAVHKHDEPRIQAILGAGNEITSTGDNGEDQLQREHFTQKYREMHRLVREPDGTTVLYIGAENWPFPIPLTASNGRWSFDSKAGSQELLFRRIGENEATALAVCRALVPSSARHHAAPATPVSPAAAEGDPIRDYASIVARAALAGAQPEPSKFNGYFFRALGPEPAKRLRVTDDRVIGGKSTDVLAFVAYPAEYRASGVMTFVVAKNGLIYERDLGPETLVLAQSLPNHRPTSAWRLVNTSSLD